MMRSGLIEFINENALMKDVFLKSTWFDILTILSINGNE